jgi:hypothetical protein
VSEEVYLLLSILTFAYCFFSASFAVSVRGKLQLIYDNWYLCVFIFVHSRLVVMRLSKSTQSIQSVKAASYCSRGAPLPCMHCSVLEEERQN